MSYETAFDEENFSDVTSAVDMVDNQNRFYALLEKHPVIILPLYCWDDKTDEQANRMVGFLFSLFSHNGIVTTDAAGVSLDPSILGHSRDGLYKHSKMRKTDFLILTDVHGEDSGAALERLALMAAVDCKMPFVAMTRGKGFEAAVDILTPPENPDGGGWETIKSAPLLNMILQSRYSASPSPLLDVPFAIECVYRAVDTEKKLYKLTAETELLAQDAGNNRFNHWEDYPARG